MLAHLIRLSTATINALLEKDLVHSSGLGWIRRQACVHVPQPLSPSSYSPASQSLPTPPRCPALLPCPCPSFLNTPLLISHLTKQSTEALLRKPNDLLPLCLSSLLLRFYLLHPFCCYGIVLITCFNQTSSDSGL